MAAAAAAEAMPAVFSDQDLTHERSTDGGVGEVAAVEWRSTWSNEVGVSDGWAQTSAIVSDEVATEPVGTGEMAVQTDPEAAAAAAAPPPELDELPPDVYAAVVKAATAAAELLIPELEANVHSHAFDGYTVELTEERTKIGCEYTLSHEALAENGLQCTAIEWNSTGAVIFAAYGRVDDIESWYAHKSTICSWNIDRYFLTPTKADSAIEMSSCVGSLACHPDRPSMLATGMYDGGIAVLDMARPSGQEVAFGTAAEDAHTEPVMQVKWVTTRDAVRGKVTHTIVSMAGDGRVLQWSLPKEGVAMGRLVLQGRSVVRGSDLRRSIKTSKAGSGTEVGLASLALFADSLSAHKFVVGTESGGLLQCTLTEARPPDMPEGNPVLTGHSPHDGAVYGVACSPLHRNLFLSCSSDGSARLFNALYREPILTVEPGLGYLLGAAWSASRPTVFAVAAEGGKVAIYDLASATGRVAPAATLVVNDNKSAVYSVAFNPSKSRYLATADGGGVIKVWALSDGLTKSDGTEATILDRLADEVDADD